MHPRNKVASSLKELLVMCQIQRELGQKIVLTSGCFDLLHGGHLEYIYEAGKMGYLVVGINSDTFVKKLKGENRPIRDQDDRALLIAGFTHVGLVAIFDCDYELIRTVRPDVYVASETSHLSIWNDEKRVSLLKGMGAEIVEIESKKQDSTTDIIRRAAK